jgi:hypothetical protein
MICHDDEHVADLLSRFDVLVGLGDLVERVSPIDDGPERRIRGGSRTR